MRGVGSLNNMPLYTRVKLTYGPGPEPKEITIPEDKWKTYQRTAEVSAVQMEVPFYCMNEGEQGSCGNVGDYLVMNMKGDLQAVERDVFESLWTERSDCG